MKHCSSSLLLMAVIAIISVSCQIANIDSDGITDAYKEPVNHKVTSADIQNYIFGLKGEPQTKASLITIDPIVNGVDTVLYLVNYENGWEVLSGDRRLSRVLIKSDAGNITVQDLYSNPTCEIFMEDLCDGVACIIHDNSIETPEVITDSWDRVLDPPGPVLMLVSVLISTDTLQTTTTKLQNHFIQTKWGQGDHWNQYAPYEDETRTTNCLTGCVPVAASQILYYLHSELGTPSACYGTASCNAYVPSVDPYYLVLSSSDVSFSDYSSAHWASMPLNSATSNGADKVSALMVYLGYLYQARYRIGGTGVLDSYFTDYSSNLFSTNFGIDCDVYDIESGSLEFFIQTAEEQLYQNEMPIMMAIKRQANNTWRGHCVVLDGYKEEEHQLRYNYAVYEADLNGRIIPFQDPVRYYSELGIGYSRYIAINWGWDGFGDSTNGSTNWYNVSCNWVVSGRNYTRKCAIVYGFDTL